MEPGWKRVELKGGKSNFLIDECVRINNTIALASSTEVYLIAL